ncbi:hypothetical protein B0A48_17692 [Cryoendolithus antarcticus]|uniref:Uncharacterized protein n=1 Tax=Cryoendolithus antarcticus TaxID=1507870 RepID=A0A1V8SAK5_9PEZI|nr:hypothetical protein B0A48_17692 [Cryoendolithus antarcticus]
MAARIEVMWGSGALVKWSSFSVLCKDVCVQCGDYSDDLSDDEHAGSVRRQAALRRSVMHSLLNWTDHLEAPTPGWAHQSLGRILDVTHASLCSDVRDRIYGTLSLVDWTLCRSPPTTDYSRSAFQLAGLLLTYYQPSAKPLADVGAIDIASVYVNRGEGDAFAGFASKVITPLRLGNTEPEMLALWEIRTSRYIAELRCRNIGDLLAQERSMPANEDLSAASCQSSPLYHSSPSSSLDRDKLINVTMYHKDRHAIRITSSGEVLVGLGTEVLRIKELALAETHLAWLSSHCTETLHIPPPRIISAVDGTLGGFCCSDAAAGDWAVFYDGPTDEKCGYGLILRPAEPADENVLSARGSRHLIIGQAVLFAPIRDPACDEPESDGLSLVDGANTHVSASEMAGDPLDEETRGWLTCSSSGSPSSGSDEHSENDIYREFAKKSYIPRWDPPPELQSIDPKLNKHSPKELPVGQERPISSAVEDGSDSDLFAEHETHHAPGSVRNTFTILWDSEGALIFHWRDRDAAGGSLWTELGRHVDDRD